MGEFFGEFSPGLVIVMVLGLVELCKKLGLEGNKLLLVAMGIGIGLGALGEVVVQFPEVLPWVKIVVYGVLTGLTASGLYDVGKRYIAQGK